MSPRPSHRMLAIAGWSCAVTVALAALGAAVLDSQWFARVLIHRLAAASGRTIRVEGALRAQLLSLEPRLTAERVRIDNPFWMPAGEMARIGAVTVVVRLPRRGHSFEIGELRLEAAVLTLLRDRAGNTNWQFSAPGVPATPLPMVRRLSLPEARVALRDERLRLDFKGRLSGADAAAPGAGPFRLQGDGILNGRPVRFGLEGDPLARVRQNGPWHFAFFERSSGSQLSGTALLPHAYDFATLDASFAAAGEDLRDLYFLTGVKLPDTAAYRLSGRVQRRPNYLLFSDLEVTSARSDLHATVLIGGSGRQSEVDADLQCSRLRLKDIGAVAARRAPPPPPAVFPDSPLGLESFRDAQGEVRFRAQRLELSGLTLADVESRIRIGRAHLSALPLSARYAGGTVSARIEADLAARVPTVALELSAEGLRLAELSSGRAQSAPAPVDGPLDVRARLQGEGDSPRALAASASGRVSVLLPQGRIRASLAQLIGLNIARALGLTLRHSAQETPLRCALARLDARTGVFQVERLLIDTPPARITGTGALHLDSETLDLTLEDRPNEVHLPWRIPVHLRGPLLHPSLSPGGHGAVVKAGIGSVLAPLEHAFGAGGRSAPSECDEAIAEAGRDGVGELLR